MNIKLASAWTFLKFIVSGVSNSHFMTEGRALMSYDFGLQSLELAKLLEISGAGYNTQIVMDVPNKCVQKHCSEHAGSSSLDVILQ